MSDDVSGCASREAEARERLDGDWMCEHPEGDVDRSADRKCEPCVDVYRAAVRATLRAELRERIEGWRDAARASRELWMQGMAEAYTNVLSEIGAGEPEGGA